MKTLGRLFAGTPWDRPPRCERCGRLEADCNCPPPIAATVRLDPSTQTARLRIERRPRGKIVTVVSGLDPIGNDLDDLAGRLKARCGAGGTVKDGRIEIQGDHLAAAEATLAAAGYQTRRG